VIRVHTFSGGGFGENGYLVVSEEGGLGVVIDPGAAAASMARHIRDERVRIAAILLTHAHLDHVEGVPEIRGVAPEAPIYLHPEDHRLYEGVGAQARAFNLPLVGPLPPPDRELAHGEILEFPGFRFRVRFSPGHAPGHVILYCEEESLAFVGDVIFRGGIGRADLIGGDFHQLMQSIHEQILSLPDETRLLSGHGPETTVGWERRTNPFLVGHYGGEFA
jgi:glyoxylase-like metal-dependent hydrolase (beta-lactamase superfamily II)